MNSQNNEIQKIKFNKLNIIPNNQINQEFNIEKDLELKEIFESNKFNTFESNKINTFESNKINTFEPSNIMNMAELELMVNSLPIINENIRSNINLSIALFKKINNFDHNNIHNIVNEKSNNSFTKKK